MEMTRGLKKVGYQPHGYLWQKLQVKRKENPGGGTGFLEEGQGGLCGMLDEGKSSSWGQDRAGARGVRSG